MRDKYSKDWLIKGIILLLVFSWGGWVGINFWSSHPEFARGFSLLYRHLLPVFLLLVFLSLCLVIGYRIFKSFRLLATPLETILFSKGFGLAFFIYLALLMGVFRLLYPEILYILFLLLPCLCLKEVKELSIIFKEALKPKEREEQVPKIILFILLLFILVSFISTLTPRISWDEAVYHLNVPKQYIEANGIVFIPRNVYSNMPLNIEMLYMLALLLNGPILAKLLHFTFGLLCFFVIYSWGDRFFSRRIGALAGLIFLLNPVVSFELNIAYIDLGLTFYTILGLYAFLLWRRSRNDKWLIMMAIFSGVALGCKYTSFSFLLIFGIGIIFGSLLDRAGAREMVSRIGVFLGISLLFFSPWMIKNILLVGNPVYPFAFGIFGGPEWCEEFSVRWKDFLLSIGMGRGFKDYLLLPWNIVVHGKSGPAFDGTVDPFWLIFFPLLFFIRGNRVILYLLAYSFLSFIFWAISTQQLRFFIPTLPSLAIVSAYTIENISFKGGIFKTNWFYRLIMGLVIFLLISIEIPYMATIAREDIPYLIGIESKEAYLSRTHKPYAIFKYINQELPKDSRLLFLWENRGFYCERSYLAESLFDASWIMKMAVEAGSAGKFSEVLRKMKITHILVNRFWQPKFGKEKGMEIVEDFLRRETRFLSSKDDHELYEILPKTEE